MYVCLHVVLYKRENVQYTYKHYNMLIALNYLGRSWFCVITEFLCACNYIKFDVIISFHTRAPKVSRPIDRTDTSYTDSRE